MKMSIFDWYSNGGAYKEINIKKNNLLLLNH